MFNLNKIKFNYQEMCEDWEGEMCPSVKLIVHLNYSIEIKNKSIKNDYKWISILKNSSLEYINIIKLEKNDSHYKINLSYDKNNANISDTIDMVVLILKKYNQKNNNNTFKVVSL
jgi:hypothetical protein